MLPGTRPLQTHPLEFSSLPPDHPGRQASASAAAAAPGSPKGPAGGATHRPPAEASSCFRIGQAIPIRMRTEGLVVGALAAYRLRSPGEAVVQAFLPDGRRVEAVGRPGATLALSREWGARP